MTREGGILDEGVIGEAKVATSTVMWECLVLCNEEGIFHEGAIVMLGIAMVICGDDSIKTSKMSPRC